jgi:hypothetical protein
MLAAWLIAPLPLDDAVTVSVLVPTGVPVFPVIFVLLLPLEHEVTPTPNPARTNAKANTSNPRPVRFLQTVSLSISIPGNNNAK